MSQERRASGEEKTVSRPGVYGLIGTDGGYLHRDPNFSNSTSNLNLMGGDHTASNVHSDEDVGLQGGEREAVVVDSVNEATVAGLRMSGGLGCELNSDSDLTRSPDISIEVTGAEVSIGPQAQLVVDHGSAVVRPISLEPINGPGCNGGIFVRLAQSSSGPLKGWILSRSGVEQFKLSPVAGCGIGGLSLRKKTISGALKEEAQPQHLNRDLLIVGSRYRRVGVV